MVNLSIVISFKNEEQNLPVLLERLVLVLKSLEEVNSEIIFVNDLSTDSSKKFLEEYIVNSLFDISLVNMSRTYGNTECVFAGFEVSKGDLVIYMDADLQDPPELIPEMIAKHFDTKAEVIHTVRTKRLGESWFKIKITNFGYFYLNKFYQVPLKREAGDYKLLTRRVVECLLEYKEHLPFLRGLIANLGFKQEHVEYIRDPRADGRSKTKFRVFGLRWLGGHLDRTLISFSDIPLKFTLFIGLLLFSISSVGIILAISLKIFGLAVPGWTALICAILFLGSTQILVTGFLGLYINVIFRETKNRPIYIIDNIVKNNKL